MPVLRSRVIPLITPKSPQNGLLIEPVTPAKAAEGSNIPSDTRTISPNHVGQSSEHLKLGLGSESTYVLGNGTVVRRSSRLNSKSISGGVVSSVVSSRKRKIITGEEYGNELKVLDKSRNGNFGADVEVAGSGGEVCVFLRPGRKILKGGDISGNAGNGDAGIECGDGDNISSNGSDVAFNVEVDSGIKEKVTENISSGDCLLEEIETDGRAGCSIRRISREDKGKGKAVEVGLSSNHDAKMESDLGHKLETSNGSEVPGATSSVDDLAGQDGRLVLGNSGRANTTITSRTERFLNVARKNASRFAHFPSQEEDENQVVGEAEREVLQREMNEEVEDWPGPFSTAMKIIKDRETKGMAQQSSCLDKSDPTPVKWIPRKDQHNRLKLVAPSLRDLCLTFLAKNADAITSLDCVPDVLRHKLSQLLCDSRRMNAHFVDLLVSGSPTEIRVKDCSWLSEEQFTKTFNGCDITKLTVLQLDQCGRCLPDYTLFATLARFPNQLSALTTISVKGACRLSDSGVKALVSSAPTLRSINLSQCSLLTADAIDSLAETLGAVLKELYLDDCESIDPMLILPALSKLKHLEVLSLSGIQTVCDNFVIQFVAACGQNLKEISLANCMKLTDSTLKAIAETCSGLYAIDLTNLRKLTNSALGYLANGCQAIQTLKLCHNGFSDEAVAAYLETSGEPLKVLSLNNVKVAHNTAISLAKQSRNLLSLDLSWCRKVGNEALGLIVDSCLSLKVLKLFGCTQITDVFIDGHSNPQVQVIGLKFSPILKHIEVPELVGPLHYSSA